MEHRKRQRRPPQTPTGDDPRRVAAVLFCRLARLAVWGHQHNFLISQFPELGVLLEDADDALAHAGALAAASQRRTPGPV